MRHLSFAAVGLFASVPSLHAQVPTPRPETPAQTEPVRVGDGAPAQTTTAPPGPAVPNAITAPLPTAGLPYGSPACDTLCESFWTRSTMTGDWAGVRPRLQETGITFGGNLTQFAFGIGGGVNRPVLPAMRNGDTFEYTGRGEYEMKVDLEKFGGMPKGSLVVRAQNWFGRYGNVTPSTGSFPPAVFAAAIPPTPNHPGTPIISDFFVTQPLSKNWVVFAGKKNVLGAADQDEFAGGNGISQFTNQAFVANPAFLLGLPYTAFTAGVVSPRDWGAFSAFVYDPQDRTRDFFRVDDMFSQGVIVGGEVKVKSNFFCMPGDQHVGAIWKHRELTDLRFNEPDPAVYPEQVVPGFPTIGDSYTIYTGFDQYLQVYSQESKRGWGLFGRASISDGNPTPVQYFLSAGIGGYSPFAYQRGDTFGLAWYYLGASKEFGPLPRAVVGPRDGMGVEVFYNVQITPWINFTPDFQIIRPEAGRIADTAYIGGVRLSMKF